MSTESEAVTLPPLWRRLPMVLYAPTRLGAALREKPAWFWAFALGLPVGLLGPWLIPREVWIGDRPVGGGPWGLQGMGRELAASVDVIVTGVVWVLWAVAFPTIVAVALKLIGGGSTRFRHVLACSVHAMWIVAVGWILIVPLRIATGDPYVTLSVGSALGWGLDGWLERLAVQADLFVVWFSIATAVMLSGEGGPGRARAVVVSLATTLVLIGTMARWAAS